MSDKSAIEWTDSSWNPIVGCSIFSPGCARCYAMRMAARLERINPTGHYAGTTKSSKAGAVWTGKVALAPDHILTQPLRWKKPRRIFVNSMGDLFHESIPDKWIDRVFAVMALCPRYTFQVLTKRAERMQTFLSDVSARDRQIEYVAEFGGVYQQCVDHELPLPNVWLGVSAERQREADERIPHLLNTPAAVRFVSCEPLLGPIDLKHLAAPRVIGVRSYDEYLDALLGERCSVDTGCMTKDDEPWLDWVIVGGESGPGARPMYPDWARSLRDQCDAADVPFFFKQWGEYLPIGQSLPGYGKVHGATAVKPGRMKLHYGGTPERAPKHAFAERGVEFASTSDGRLTFHVGKKAAGRLLDGKEHNEFPRAEAR